MKPTSDEEKKDYTCDQKQIDSIEVEAKPKSYLEELMEQYLSDKQNQKNSVSGRGAR